MLNIIIIIINNTTVYKKKKKTQNVWPVHHPDYTAIR